MNIKEMLEKTAGEVPQKTAIVLGSQRVSYGELDEASNRVANALINLGLQKGDHVGILMSYTPELKQHMSVLMMSMEGKSPQLL